MLIGLVSASPLAILLEPALGSGRQFELAWRAESVAAARAQAELYPPEMLIVDVAAVGGEPAALVRTMMEVTPRPVAVILLVDDSRPPGGVFEALSAGPVHIAPRPGMGDDGRIRGVEGVVAIIKQVTCLLGLDTPVKAARPVRPRPARVSPPGSAPAKRESAGPAPRSFDRDVPSLVVLGASTGGPVALSTVFKGLPGDVPAAFVAVQHVDGRFAEGLGAWLQTGTALPVALAQGGEQPQQGRILAIAGNDDFILDANGILSRVPPDPGGFYHPSVDLFFESVARSWPAAGIAVLLTGMGRDGALGLRRLRDAGWHTIAQDAQTSIVYGMPRAAAELEAAVEVLPLEKIAAAILRRLTLQRPAPVAHA